MLLYRLMLLLLCLRLCVEWLCWGRVVIDTIFGRLFRRLRRSATLHTTTITMMGTRTRRQRMSGRDRTCHVTCSSTRLDSNRHCVCVCVTLPDHAVLRIRRVVISRLLVSRLISIRREAVIDEMSAEKSTLGRPSPASCPFPPLPTVVRAMCESACEQEEQTMRRTLHSTPLH